MNKVDFAERNRGVPMAFVVGSGRCGTTLLKNILDRHPDIATIPELQFFRFIMGKRAKYRDYNDIKTKEFTYKKLMIMLTNIPIESQKVKNINKNFIRQGLFACQSYLEAFIFITKYTATKKSYKYIVQKTPSDIFYIDQIFNFFPEAKIIHLIRDGREVVASARKAGWGRDNYNQAAQWNLAINYYFKFKKKFKRKRRDMLEIKYEDLASRPEEKIGELFDFLGIKTWPNSFFDFKDFNFSNSSFGDKNGGLYISKNFDSFFSETEKMQLAALMYKNLKKLKYDITVKPKIGAVVWFRHLMELMKFRLFCTLSRMGRNYTYYAIGRKILHRQPFGRQSQNRDKK